jgi:hypothetical protein
VHQVRAITDCVFFEASTPHFDDRERLEARYGLPETGGLPTTNAGVDPADYKHVGYSLRDDGTLGTL